MLAQIGYKIKRACIVKALLKKYGQVGKQVLLCYQVKCQRQYKNYRKIEVKDAANGVAMRTVNA